jgi:hypothetical protein
LSSTRAPQAERRGVAPAVGKAGKRGADGTRRAPDGTPSEAERKELQKMLMKKKDARLYKQMQFGIARKQAAVDKLAAKRAKLASSGDASAPTGKGGKRSSASKSGAPPAKKAKAGKS